ncbi:MAG TPA: hypothetical protein GXX57_09860 [Firmicutes bacterium]|nr:hypothetical protein [Bacillota bacterium]
MPLWSVLLLAISVSLDSFTVGVAYSLQGIRIPVSSLLIIGLCTASLLGLSLFLGQSATGLIPGGVARILGGGVLMVIGLGQLLQGLRSCFHQLRRKIRFLAFLDRVGFLKDPGAFDLDRSGSLDRLESVLLGLALGLDALVAGFAASLIGFTWWHIPLVSLVCVGLVYLGSLAGRYHREHWFNRRGSLVAGCLLIGLGCWRLFF